MPRCQASHLAPRISDRGSNSRRANPPGLYITGTSTGVGKTHVAAMIARALVAEGRRVGVYKPVASGCRREGNVTIADDALRSGRRPAGPVISSTSVRSDFSPHWRPPRGPQGRPPRR